MSACAVNPRAEMRNWAWVWRVWRGKRARLAQGMAAEGLTQAILWREESKGQRVFSCVLKCYGSR